MQLAVTWCLELSSKYYTKKCFSENRGTAKLCHSAELASISIVHINFLVLIFQTHVLGWDLDKKIELFQVWDSTSGKELEKANVPSCHFYTTLIKVDDGASLAIL